MYTTKRVVAIMLAVLLVLGMVSTVSAAGEISVSISSRQNGLNNSVECERGSTFELFFGANKFVTDGKTLNTYEFTVWYNDRYVTVEAGNSANVSSVNGYLYQNPTTAQKVVRGITYKGTTFTFTSYETGFGTARSNAFNALLKIKFRATNNTGVSDIFIEDGDVTLLPVVAGNNFADTIDSKVSNKSVSLTVVNSNGGTFGGGAVPIVKTVVVFNVDGIKTVVTLGENQKVAQPANPTKDGYAFVGWYKDSNFLVPFDFNSVVSSSIELFAKFEKINGPAVKPELPFVDVAEADWFYEGVKYVFEKNMVKGISETQYGPDVTLNRATLVTLIHRLENEPSAPANVFSDVSNGAWYENAVAWASANEIVLGVGEGLFAPEANITREQIAVILYKHTKFKGGDVSKSADLNVFVDADKISDWAKDALSWAVAEGLIQGMGDGEVAPNATATRAQIATILMRYMQ